MEYWCWALDLSCWSTNPWQQSAIHFILLCLGFAPFFQSCTSMQNLVSPSACQQQQHLIVTTRQADGFTKIVQDMQEWRKEDDFQGCRTRHLSSLVSSRPDPRNKLAVYPAFVNIHVWTGTMVKIVYFAAQNVALCPKVHLQIQCRSSRRGWLCGCHRTMTWRDMMLPLGRLAGSSAQRPATAAAWYAIFEVDVKLRHNRWVSMQVKKLIYSRGCGGQLYMSARWQLASSDSSPWPRACLSNVTAYDMIVVLSSGGEPALQNY